MTGVFWPVSFDKWKVLYRRDGGYMCLLCEFWNPSFRLIDYEQSLFFLGPSSKTCEIRKWPRAWLKALVSRLSRLRRSTLALACTPLTKSEEKERETARSLFAYWEESLVWPCWYFSFAFVPQSNLWVFCYHFISIMSLFEDDAVCPNLTLTKAHSSSSNIVSC